MTTNEMPKPTIAAVLVNDKGQILPYTCKSTVQQVKEHCDQHMAGWERLSAIGCRIAQCEITVIEIFDKETIDRF